MTNNLYAQLCKPDNLFKAWQKVYANGVNSSNDTKKEIKKFNDNVFKNVPEIARKLRDETFSFDGSKGILLKKKRPIVVSPVEARIVQRAILNILQKQEAIKKYLQVTTSFGAIEGKGVPDAIKAFKNAINFGAKYYIKSDIASFFTNVRFEDVEKILAGFIGDEKFLACLARATKLEITNIERLRKEHRNHFDYTEHGIPQGCCLSPLYANIALYNFDIEANKFNGITCLRYLDDFIILGAKYPDIDRCFNMAISELKKCGLTAYRIGENEKAKRGQICKGVEFLGVKISGKEINIQPTKEKCTALKKRVEKILSDGWEKFNKIGNNGYDNYSFIKTLTEVSTYLKAWGNTYFFCNNDACFDSLDRAVDKFLKKYHQFYSKKISRLKLDSCSGDDIKKLKKFRRLLGVFLLCDRKKKY